MRLGRTARSGSPTAASSSIGRITTSGVVTNYTGSGISRPVGITAGPDGALWFTNDGEQLDRADHDRAASSPTTRAPASVDPAGIAAGPDGALWFTNTGNNSIGRITTSGVVTNYTGTGIATRPGSRPGRTAPSGSPTGTGNNSIGRITTGGDVTNYTGTGISDPDGIAAGPDGALWFTNCGSDSIGRITTGGVVTNYTGTGISVPAGITAGPDGALWFTNYGNDSIGRITTGGVVTNYTGPGISEPFGITARAGRRPVVHQRRQQLDRADRDERRRLQLQRLPRAGE